MTTEDILDEDVPDGQVVGQDPAAGEPFAEEITLTVARQPVITFLADQNPVEGSVDEGPVRISGETHTRSVSLYLGFSGDEHFAGYDLGRHYRQVRTTVGIADDAASASEAIVEIFGDGREIFRETLTLGDSVPIDLDVTGVLRLEIQATNVGETGGFYAVLGDVQVLGTQDEVPEPDEES